MKTLKIIMVVVFLLVVAVVGDQVGASYVLTLVGWERPPDTPIASGTLGVSYKIEEPFTAVIEPPEPILEQADFVRELPQEYNWSAEYESRKDSTTNARIEGTCFGVRVDSIKITSVKLDTRLPIEVYRDSISTTPERENLLSLHFTPDKRGAQQRPKKSFWRAQLLVGAKTSPTTRGVHPVFGTAIGISKLPIELN